MLFIVGALLAALVQAPTHKTHGRAAGGAGERRPAGRARAPRRRWPSCEANGKKMAMTGGILHLLLLLMLIDMIWKPGL